MKYSNTAPRSTHSGVTLVELMVVVLIVSILAGIAYPGYRSHVVKTQRGAAKACLMEYAAFMERFYTTNLTYAGAAPGNLGCALEGNMPQNYTFSLPSASLTATTYTVTAAPTSEFAKRETQCGTLSLNQAGAKSASAGTIAECW